MIDRKIKIFKDRTQKISTFFLAILLLSQALMAIPPDTPHTDINHPTTASTKNSKQSNYITQND